MQIWLTTDTHFGHAKLKELAGRPDKFEDKIFTGLLQNVKFGDLLIHLGDFCIGHDDYWNNWFTHSLPCKKWLVLGNHDKKAISWYLTHGWDWVGKDMTLEIFGHRIFFTHEPMGWRADGINVHGHLHGNDHRDGEMILDPNFNFPLALEKTNYQPVTLRKFIGE
jgi:calcineurin-like phosphoesterase family protein